MVPLRNRGRRGTHAVSGRAAALAALGRIRPGAYARSRNFLDGAVTRLSPYVRHGVLSLAEIRDAVVRSGSRPAIDTLVRELAWRDFYVRVRAAIGDDVSRDIEPLKTGEPPDAYASDLPADVERGETGAACIDAFVRELVSTGYVHNHARMWFASYVVHVRRVRWQEGAFFFRRHLLDGDPASNDLSWQWVASTFSHKPYVFNRANLERYSHGVFCARCPLATAGCPFEGSYDRLSARLFPHGARPVDDREPRDLRVPADPAPAVPPPRPARAIVWQHEESLSAVDPARSLAPDADAIFVWDREARARDPWPAMRRDFVNRCLEELALQRVATGDAALEVGAFARERNCERIVAVEPVDPRLRAIARELASTFDVVLVPQTPFARLDRPVDLRRFSRYWSRAERTAFGDAATQTRFAFEG